MYQRTLDSFTAGLSLDPTREDRRCKNDYRYPVCHVKKTNKELVYARILRNCLIMELIKWKGVLFMNFVFISPNFPENYWMFCRGLKKHWSYGIGHRRLSL